ncbi:hypothetical protein Vadar_031598 [Vaccinium darrowii]|uniref:Uncharacterized protein n=1 Tax=Vaccinium darrowii TaxID=229202 RepID=A0ACB7Y366_9ERIC|nr:hypothetical protein Vadar_031598 [Vaccinium darrowii]
MSTARSITPCSLTKLQIKPCSKSETFICNSSFPSVSLKQSERSCFAANGGGLRYLSSGRGSQRGRNGKMDLVVYSSNVEPGAPLPSDPSSNSWRGWVVGALISIILPFLGNKWGPLFKLSKDVEQVAERAEEISEAIEKVSEKVDKVAEDVAEELPEGGKLRKAIESVEKAAEEVDKAAEVAHKLIDQVQEVDKEVESLMEPVKDQAKVTAKEASDQKVTESENKKDS